MRHGGRNAIRVLAATSRINGEDYALRAGSEFDASRAAGLVRWCSLGWHIVLACFGVAFPAIGGREIPAADGHGICPHDVVCLTGSTGEALPRV